MSVVIDTLISLAIVAAITFGVLAAFPRKRRALPWATITLVAIFLVMSALGSALVGPLDLRPMFILTPIMLVFVGIWYRWKIRPLEADHG